MSHNVVCMFWQVGFSTQFSTIPLIFLVYVSCTSVYIKYVFSYSNRSKACNCGTSVEKAMPLLVRQIPKFDTATQAILKFDTVACHNLKINVRHTIEATRFLYYL